MKVYIFCLMVFLSANLSQSQKLEYTTVSIADSLKQNANAVVRLDRTDIAISSQRNMEVSYLRAVTVFNEKGMDAIKAYANYDKRTSVNSIQATVYDGSGNEIKKIRRKDFRDQCVLDGVTLFSDNRVIYLDYTPTQFPFTVVYECDFSTSNTAFIPTWYPLLNYLTSVEKSTLTVTFPEDLGFKKKEANFGKFQITNTSNTSKKLSYTAVNIPAQKEESYSPEYYECFPKVLLGLEYFNLEGVDGNAKSWREFGQWYAEKILAGTTVLPEETKAKISALVGNEKEPIKKAKIVYRYVQQKSRYVSIQVGIGGFKPMPAKDVDRLGYGDCKALTNYTKALLEAVGVPSYNTILYGGREKRDIESDFVSIQGNHMILSVPDGDRYIWLECTSQDAPFGYQANFTDDRNVLVIKPTGGEIVHTTIYQNHDNFQMGKGQFSINENGDLVGDIAMVSEGSQYGSKSNIENKLPTEKEQYYKDYWSNIANLKIGKIAFSNDKEKVAFTENLSLSAANYAAISGKTMMIVPNAYNRFGGIKRIRNRKTPFEIQRGFHDVDEIAIVLPAGFLVESLPKDFEIKTKYGEYKTTLVKNDNGNLTYNRSLLVKSGRYANTEYEDYRLFMEQVSRNDNAKIILTRNQ